MYPVYSDTPCTLRKHEHNPVLLCLGGNGIWLLYIHAQNVGFLLHSYAITILSTSLNVTPCFFPG
jgi:hypothetical protein